MSMFPSLSVSVTFFSLSASHSPLFHTHFTPCQRENYSLCQVSQEIPNKDSNIPYTLCIFPGGSDGKVSACSVGDPDLILGLGRPPWRSEWQPTPVVLPGEFRGQRSLVGYSPEGCKRVRHKLVTKKQPRKKK